MIITADHGNDPTYTGTDHTREYTPFIAYSKSMKENGRLEDQDTFAVIGATIADNFGCHDARRNDRNIFIKSIKIVQLK